MRISHSVLAILCAASPITAGKISGTVTDSSGAAIPGARVTVHSRDNALRWSAEAGPDGAFQIDAVPPGDYLLEASAAGLTMPAAPMAVKPDTGWSGRLEMFVDRVRQEVVVTATGAAQSIDETARSVDVIRAEDFAARAEYSLVDSIQTTPGVRVQTLGGPGGFTRVLMRGMRSYDTSVTIDGLRLRDAATTQGDSTPFLENLMLADTSRAEVLRGTGSSIYGTNAIGGVVNLVTEEGGGRAHGNVEFEGGGLGFLRGLARIAGGARANQLNYSAGFQHLNVLNGVDGNDPYRNIALQSSLLYRPASSFSLSGRFYGGDGMLGLNDSPFSAPASALPASGVIHAVPIPWELQRQIENGGRVTFPPGTNYVPNLDDPDSRRTSRYAASAIVATHQFHPRASWRASYQNVYTRRQFDDGPGGVRFEPQFNTEDYIRGRIDTVQVRGDFWLTRASLLSGGYEWEGEDYYSQSQNFAPAPAKQYSLAQAKQSSNTGFIHSQNRFLSDRLQVSLSARIQAFQLTAPTFQGGAPPYPGAGYNSPATAATLDAGFAWFNPSTGTKFRAHGGNGYRAPSIFERFGSSYFLGSFSALGDPRLSPERSIGFDGGIDQYLFRERLRLSATYFYTDLREAIAFDTSGFVNPGTDPWGRFGGYRNTTGGIARGIEVSAEIALPRRARVLGSYTYSNSDQRTSTVRDNDFFRAQFIPIHQFTANAVVPITRRIDVSADAFIVSSHPFVMSRRAFLFPGARKVDLVGSYTKPLADQLSLRFFAKASNTFNHAYFENGFRAPQAWATFGISFQY
jgi:iron complex outermembrane receptor protein